MIHLNTQTGNVTSGTSVTVKKPAGTQYKDIIWAYVFNTNANGAYISSAPSGWTRHAYNTRNGDPGSVELFYKIATNAEPDTYTWTMAGADTFMVTLSSFRGGFNPANPVNVTSNTLYYTDNGTIRAASMTTTAANLNLLLFVLWSESTYTSYSFTDPTAPTTWTLDYSHINREMGYFWPRIYHTFWTGSGATGDMDTVTNRSDETKHAFAVALNAPVVATIAGNVKKGGANLAGATVRLFHKDMGCLASKTTDANGNYSFSGDYGSGDYVIAGETYHVVIEYTDGSSNKFNAKSLWGVVPTT
jgi:hypothetical protein